jgi:predicted RNA-binding protein with PUA-like domain
VAQARQYWLLKADPAVFGFDDLLAAPGKTTFWDGVRNYQARNFLRAMRAGDLAFFYHSSSEPPGIVGIVEIASAAVPDPTQFVRGHAHYDARAKQSDPPWSMVEVRAQEPLARLVALEELRASPACASLAVCRRGNRLSVTPVQGAEWRAVLALAKRKSTV